MSCKPYDPCSPVVPEPAECDPDAEKGFGLVRPVDRGCTTEIEYGPIVDANGVPFDFSVPGMKAWFTVKRYLYQIDSQAAWQGTLVSGIVQESRGMLVVTIPPEATANIPDGVDRLYYDLRMRDTANRVSTLEKGQLAVSPTATRSIV